MAVFRLQRLGLMLPLLLVLRCASEPAATAPSPRTAAEPSASLKSAPAPQRESCVQGADPHLLVVEPAVMPGKRVRILVVSERPLGDAHLMDGRSRPLVRLPFPVAGPPYARLYEARAPQREGRPAFRLTRPRGQVLACVRAEVDRAAAAATRHAPASGIWRATRSWNDTWERIYSAWIAYLFRPLPDQRNSGWWPLHQVLHNPVRNLLFNRLGLHEDEGRHRPRVVAVADCGDTPYQLRAYFAWKFELPFRFRRCTRGDSIRGPRCPVSRDNQYAGFDHYRHPVLRFNAFIRRGLAWIVHSGTTRTLPEDEGSDFYPIALTREAIRPGTIFVDVGGHVLVVSQWDRDGLYAIDGHPDFSVTRRRFGKKYFRFFRGNRTGGFKAFRPLLGRAHRPVPVPNRALRRFFSVQQYRFRSRRAFYRAMDRLIRVRG